MRPFLLSLLLTLPPSADSAPVPQWVHLRLQHNLEQSVVHSLPEQGEAMAAQVARLLRWRGELRKQVHRGDELTLLFARTPPPPGEPSSAAQSELLALHYRGAQLRLRAYRFVGADGIGRYYTAAGERVEPRLKNAPVPRYAQITDVVQVRRRGQRGHRGIDLKAAEGEAIVSPFAGRVRRLNWARRRNGRCIELVFADGRLGRFLHLARLAPGLRVGQSLAAGDPLGEVGSSGRSGGPHLHYELWQHGVAREPLRAAGHGSEPARLTGSALAAFTQQRDAFDRALLGPQTAAASPPP